MPQGSGGTGSGTLVVVFDASVKRADESTQASAPLVVGVLSELGTRGAEGLQLAFLVLLPLLAASSVCLTVAVRHYPSEVASVEESEVVDDDA